MTDPFVDQVKADPAAYVRSRLEHLLSQLGVTRKETLLHVTVTGGTVKVALAADIDIRFLLCQLPGRTGEPSHVLAAG